MAALPPLGATALKAGAAGAAEAPTWKLNGNVNFQVYYVNADFDAAITTGTGDISALVTANNPAADIVQDHGW